MSPRNVPASLAEILVDAASRHSRAEIILDVPLGLHPSLGTATDLASFSDLIGRTAAALGAAGVQRGDRVALVKQSNFDIVALTHAVMRIGAVPALISDRMDGRSLATMLERLAPAALITDHATATRGNIAASGWSGDGVLRLLVGEQPEQTGWHRLTPGTQVADVAPALGPEPALIVHSSGTTGVPKLIVHSADNLMRIAFAGKTQAALRSIPLRAEDRVAACLSWVHTRAAVGYALAFAKGSSVLAMSRHDPGAAADFLVRHRPTILEAHPNILLRWEQLADDPRRPLRDVRFFLSTADAIHPRTVARLLSATDRRRPLFIEVYGMSEMGPATVSFRTRAAARRGLASRTGSRSVGRPILGSAKVRVVDPLRGTPLLTGQAGSIQISTRSAFLDYLGESERRSAAFDGSWFTTGDIGRRRRSGRIELLDREIDQVEAVESCVAIEERLLSRLPDAQEIVVVRDGDGAALPVVCTETGQPLPSKTWIAATTDIPNLSEPRYISWADLPLTGTWKVRRFLLRERLAGQATPETELVAGAASTPHVEASHKRNP